MRKISAANELIVRGVKRQRYLGNSVMKNKLAVKGYSSSSLSPNKLANVVMDQVDFFLSLFVAFDINFFGHFCIRMKQGCQTLRLIGQLAICETYPDFSNCRIELSFLFYENSLNNPQKLEICSYLHISRLSAVFNILNTFFSVFKWSH